MAESIQLTLDLDANSDKVTKEIKKVNKEIATLQHAMNSIHLGKDVTKSATETVIRNAAVLNKLRKEEKSNSKLKNSFPANFHKEILKTEKSRSVAQKTTKTKQDRQSEELHKKTHVATKKPTNALSSDGVTKIKPKKTSKAYKLEKNFQDTTKNRALRDELENSVKEKKTSSYEPKLQSLMTRLLKVKDTTKNRALRDELEKVARQMLVAGRATTGLGLLSEMRSYLPTEKKLSPAQESFLKSSLSSANAWNQRRKREEAIKARAEERTQRESERFISQSKERTALSAEAGARKEEELRIKTSRKDVFALAEQEREADIQNKIDFLEKQFSVLKSHTESASAPKWTRNLLKDVKGIHKLTKGGTERTKEIGKELEYMLKPKGAKGFAGLSFGKLLTAAGIAGLLAKLGSFLWKSGARGLSEGYDILSEQAKYGSDRAIGLTKMMSTLFKIDENTAASVDRYARDFKQRLMWGEVGEKEFIGLGRMGEAGRMIMSGRAEEDPKTFLRTLQQWMLNTDSASVRSTLRQMNWSEDLMKLKLNPYNEEEFNTLVDQFEELTDKEAKAAADALAFQNDMRTISKQIDANVAELAGSVVRDPLAAVRILRNLGRSDEEIEAAYPGLIEKAEAEGKKRETARLRKARLRKVVEGELEPETPEEKELAKSFKNPKVMAKLKAALKSEAPVAEYTAPKTYNGSADDLTPKKPQTKPSDYIMYPGYTPSPNNTETKNISYENNITVPVTVNGNGASEEIGRTIGNIASEEIQTSLAQFLLSKTGDVA